MTAPGDPGARTDRESIGSAAFLRHFGHPPSWIGAAPGRINLIGEHTDYQCGLALPMAIDRWAVVAMGERDAETSRIHAADLQESCETRVTEGLEPTGVTFADHLLGVVRAFMDDGARLGQFDALLTSSIPIGSGLASSAAIKVAMATALTEWTESAPDIVTVARWCRDAEHRFVGVPCGLMDPLVSACGNPGEAVLIDFRDESWRPIELPDVRVLVVDTGVRHDLADGVYAERRRACEQAARDLGVATLREADEADLSLLDPEHRAFVRHVVTENQRVRLVTQAMQRGDLDVVGACLFEGHDSLRDDYRVSCPELDAIVMTAHELRDEGVYGARMTGGGFGGCAIVLVRPDAAESIRRHISAGFTERFGREPAIFEA